MNKRLILISAPPASGKNYVAKLLCDALGQVAYLDKDDLSPLLRRAFSVCGEAVDMDGDFYLNNLRRFEYETLTALAFSALRFSDTVVVNAPFLKEVRCAEYMRLLKKKTGDNGAELILVWIKASPEACYRRMVERNSDRDQNKLSDWDKYLKNTNFAPPLDLEASGAVDRVLIFDNESQASATHSLEKILKLWENKNA